MLMQQLGSGELTFHGRHLINMGSKLMMKLQEESLMEIRGLDALKTSFLFEKFLENPSCKQ